MTFLNRRREPSRQGARTAFTLVELLVVIGIIAILIGVLLPALNAARRNAATVACLSNMRQLGYAFQMYAGTYKNNLPVIRQDIPDPYYGEPAKSNEYWTDKLLPYVMQNSKTIFAWTSPEDGVRYKKSVLWCPTWVAERTNLDPYKNLGTDRFRTGYSMNQWPSFQPNDPNPDALPPTSQSNWRGNGSNGRYWKKNEWTSPADRLLLADSNFWFIGFSPLKGAKTLPGQNFDINTWFTGSSTPGSMNIDRYRHGKYPGSDGTIYFTRGGLAHYNILYVDGHAVTSVDPIDAYRGIRMKFP